jgi:hypothetical protein
MVAFCKGRCVIRGLLHSDDTIVMMNELKELVLTGVYGKFGCRHRRCWIWVLVTNFSSAEISGVI